MKALVLKLECETEDAGDMDLIALPKTHPITNLLLE